MGKKIEPFSAYLGSDHIGSTDFKRFLDYPAIYYAGQRGELDMSSAALEIGSAIHDVLLCGGKHTAMVPELDLRRKADKAAYATLTKNFENVVRSESDIEVITGMQNALNKDSADIAAMIEGAEVETSWYATCPESGLKLKCRPDILNLDIGAKMDLKSTRSAQNFFWEIQRHKYYIQSAFHSYVLELCDVDIKIDGWIPFEKTPPYLHGIALVDKESQSELRKYLIEGLVKMAKTIKENGEQKLSSSRLPRLDYQYSPHL